MSASGRAPASSGDARAVSLQRRVKASLMRNTLPHHPSRLPRLLDRCTHPIVARRRLDRRRRPPRAARSRARSPRPLSSQDALSYLRASMSRRCAPNAGLHVARTRSHVMHAPQTACGRRARAGFAASTTRACREARRRREVVGATSRFAGIPRRYRYWSECASPLRARAETLEPLRASATRRAAPHRPRARTAPSAAVPPHGFPEWDNLLLSHDRPHRCSREYRKLMISKNGASADVPRRRRRRGEWVATSEEVALTPSLPPRAARRECETSGAAGAWLR